MLPKEKIELVRQGECRHEIIDRQSFRKAFLYPLRNFMPTAFRTVTVAAGLVTDFLMSAIRAGAENAAPHGRGATFFNVKNGADHLRRSIVPPEIFFMVIAENLRDFRHQRGRFCAIRSTASADCRVRFAV